MPEGGLSTWRLRLHMRREGAGAPLLFLGGSSFDMRLRAPVFASRLVRRFEIVACEPRGLGRSDAPPGAWTMADYAEDAAAVMDALGWDRADVLGESFGAMTALELAIRHPGRIARLGLIAGTAGGAGGGSSPVERFLGLAPEARARAALEVQDTRFAAFARDDPGAAAVQVRARMAFEAAFLGDPGNAAGYPRLLAARAQHDVWERLNLVAAPALVLAGRHDGQAPLTAVAAMAARLPVAALRVFDGGHAVGFTTRAPVAHILGEWDG